MSDILSVVAVILAMIALTVSITSSLATRAANRRNAPVMGGGMMSKRWDDPPS